MVFVIDRVPKRPDKAGRLGVVPINLTKGAAAEPITVLRRRHGRPIGQLSMSRTPKDILAIGFQASARSESLEVAPTCVIAELAQLIDQIGHIGIAGVYQGRSLQPSAMGEANGSITVPWAPLFTMGVSVSVGPQARLALPGSAA